MKKILIVLLVLLLCGAGVTIYITRPFPLSTTSKGAAWKYDKKIATPLVASSTKSTDVTIGDLKNNGVRISIPKGSFDIDTSVTLKTPEKVPEYIQLEMHPIGSPIELSAGSSPVRLNEKMQISFQFDTSLLPKETEKKHIRILYYDGKEWEFVRPTNVDMNAGTVVFDTYHFSFFGMNKVDDETKITEAWIKSAAFDKTLRDGLNEKSDYVTNQIVDMMLKKIGISDESTKGKILADILKDDGYKDVIKAYASGDIVDGGQKVAALAGNKIVDLVPESTLSKALGSIAGSPEDIAAAGKALGNLAAGQFKDAAKIIGEQIADKFLVVTAGKIAVEVINGQIDSWKNAEVEAAFQAYKNGSNGAFWGYNVDAKDFDAVWTQMKGASRQLELEAIAKENEIRKEAGMPVLTEAEADSVRATVKESYRNQFAIRIEKDVEIAKNEENLRRMIAAYKKAGFFSGALAPSGLDKGLDYENTLDVLSHFTTKMMNDTNRFDLSDKEGLIMDKAISISDIVQGARIYFSGPDGKKKYADFLKDRFGINPYPKLSEIQGSWEKGSMTITDVILSEELKKSIAENNAPKDDGCDFSIDFEKLKGKTTPLSFSLTPNGEISGTMLFSSGGKDQKPIPFTYEDGTIHATVSESGGVGTITLTISKDVTGYGAAGSMNISYKNDMIKIIASITASKAKK